MSGYFDDAPPSGGSTRTAPSSGGAPPRSRALIWTIGVLLLAFTLLSTFTSIYTDRLWFASVDFSEVYSTLLLTRIGLFVVFGLFMGVVVGANIYLAYRFRPVFRPASMEQANLDRYRDAVEPIGKWLLLGVAGIMAVFAGASGAGQWRDYLLASNGGEFGVTEPFFGRDAGFYVFDLSWYHYLVDFTMTALVLALISAAAVHYLYGGIRLQSKADRFSGAAHAQTSVLLGLLLIFKAVDYYLDRFDLLNAQGTLQDAAFTGMRYTDENAVLPSKNILMVIALICGILLLANVFRRTWTLPAVSIALLALSAVLLGFIWPAAVQSFQVRPNEPDRERPYIARNIESTRAAYDVEGTQVVRYNAETSLSPQQLSDSAQSLPGIRLQDPSQVNRTFQQKQQVRGYYTVPDVLDVDRYEVNGQDRDMVVAVRELNQAGLPEDQQSWTNLATVYTHGYGMIAAYGNQRNADDEPVIQGDEPAWAEINIPPRGELSELNGADGYQSQVYFGEFSPLYSIVGKEPGGQDVEINVPEGSGAGEVPANNTYAGDAGVGVGSLWRKALYALKFSEPNIILSGRVNENSRILYNRTPLERAEKVAPWLTFDNDPYPVAVDGRITWVLDGYTTSNRYPLSELRSLSEMTSDSQDPRAQFATLPTDQVNYMRNSVKATVDAYSGAVTLYEWDQQDPILDVWQSVFPNAVERRDLIPEPILEHMRYPEDLFKVQRNILASYHVEDPLTFYNGSDRWDIPEDPQSTGNLQPPYRLSVATPRQDDQTPDPVFSLTSVYTPANRENLASFISVDADAAQPGDYGQLRILRLPSNTQVQGPSQIANAFASDEEIQQALLPFTRNGTSEAIYGNLLTLPVGEGLLYVQPLYTLRQAGEGNYPVLRFVLVSFGDQAGYGATLTEALNDVLGLEGNALDEEGNLGVDNLPLEPGDGDPQDPQQPGGGDPLAISQEALALLAQASDLFAQADAALANQNLARYQNLNNQARDLVSQALTSAQNEAVAPDGADGAAGAGNGDAGSAGGGDAGAGDADAAAGNDGNG
ncbi:UPF0182 family protein [Nocardioidaceae bacterium]|nr:UPF0182 family protein [Nocardioidaceae bacterium]